MHRELTPYLAEFATVAWEKPSRFASSLPGTGLPAPSLPTPGIDTSRSGTPPTLAPDVRPWVRSVDGWVAEMRTAGEEAAALRREIDRRKAGTVERPAEEDFFARTGIHLVNGGYKTREYPVPTNGTCDLGQLVWADLWMRAQAIFRKLAAFPPSGTPGTVVLAWVNNIRSLHGSMFDTANLRSRFLFTAGTRAANPMGGLLYDKGLASDAQARGVYSAPERPASTTILNAMDYAPVPSGGYRELLGTLLHQRTYYWYSNSPAQSRGGRLVAGATTLANSYFSGLLDLVPYAAGNTPYAPANVFDDPAWVASELDWFWSRSPSESTERVAQRAYTPAGRPERWRVFTIHTDIGAWMQNAYDFAKYFGDPRLTLGEVLVRTTGFYLNSYLDYAAGNGLVPREDLDAARSEGERLRAQAANEVRIATYTATGIVSAVVSAIPVVGAIIGGLLAAGTALLVELGGAASGGIYISPVLPLYDRGFAGSCRESLWISRRNPSEASTTPDPITPFVVTPPGSSGSSSESVAKGPLGIVIGVGALWLAFRLLSGGESR